METEIGRLKARTFELPRIHYHRPHIHNTLLKWTMATFVNATTRRRMINCCLIVGIAQELLPNCIDLSNPPE